MTQVFSIFESPLFFDFSYGFGHIRADSSLFLAGPDFGRIRTNYFAPFGSAFEFIRANICTFQRSMFLACLNLYLLYFWKHFLCLLESKTAMVYTMGMKPEMKISRSSV